MKQFFIGFLGLLLLAVAPQVLADTAEQAPRDADQLADTNSSQAKELEKIMTDDDAAIDDVTKWIQDNQAFAVHGAGESKRELNERIMARLQTVRTNYEAYIQRYPTNADAYLAFGSFLDDIGDEDGAHDQYEKSRALNPKNPAAWNDLANYYGENGPVTNAFVYYAKAIELNPNEPVYFENMATTVYLYRRDAMRFYNIPEPKVFDKALALYRQAIQLDPDNFALQTDYAESYYGIRPLRTNDALVAWTNALKIASDDTEREAVYIHLARVKIAAGRFAEAQAHLDAVTNSQYDGLKGRLESTMAERKKGVPSSFDLVFTNPLVEMASDGNVITNALYSTNAAPVLNHALPPSSWP
jgi:tetratricopeptide (TPR) repeat protein